MIRVVPDTNVYISALMFGGAPGLFLDLAFAGKFQIVSSLDILLELTEKLSGKFKLPLADSAAIRKRLEQKCSIVFPNMRLDLVKDDPDDNRVLEFAQSSNADYIVSGDRHLLSLASFRQRPIITVRQAKFSAFDEPPCLRLIM